MYQRYGLCLLVQLLIPVWVFAAAVQLPATGQTSCYDSTGNLVPCSALWARGQNGAVKSGVAWPDPRFVDNGNGSITDNLTGLVWLKNANCVATLGGVVKTGPLDWANALTWSRNLASGACGLSDGSVAGDWRMPNFNELESLANYQEADLAAWLQQPAQGFFNIQIFPAGAEYNHYSYWTSTTLVGGNYYGGSTRYAWVIAMKYGHEGAVNKSDASSVFVWPVRDGR